MKRDQLNELLNAIEQDIDKLVDEMSTLPASEETLLRVAELKSAAHDARLSAEVDRVVANRQKKEVER